MRTLAYAVGILYILAAPCISYGSAQQAPDSRVSVDLGVGSGSDSHRPNILVAWRNTERILEVEVLVRNLGDQPGTGKVTLELCDDTGTTLHATKPVNVAVPSRQKGGDQGTVLQMKGFRVMNLMFDELDRLNQRYKLRARIETDGADLNALDNTAVKSFNCDSRALAGATHFHRYRFVNPNDTPITARVHFDQTTLPSGWTVETEPKHGADVVINPREVMTGHILVKTPASLQNGQYVNIQTALMARSGEQVFDKDEWHLVATDKPCEASTPTASLQPNGTILVTIVANDPICGIKEASGVQVAYSLDDGATFSTRVMAYLRGNFYNKTWFEAVLGPFAPGVKVTPLVTVENNAGLIRRFNLDAVKVVEPVAVLK